MSAKKNLDIKNIKNLWNDFFSFFFFPNKKRKKAIKEISLWPDISSPTRFRIDGGVLWASWRRTDVNPVSIKNNTYTIITTNNYLMTKPITTPQKGIFKKNHLPGVILNVNNGTHTHTQKIFFEGQKTADTKNWYQAGKKQNQLLNTLLTEDLLHRGTPYSLQSCKMQVLQILPNPFFFLQILCQICPVFRQVFTFALRLLQKISEFENVGPSQKNK